MGGGERRGTERGARAAEQEPSAERGALCGAGAPRGAAGQAEATAAAAGDAAALIGTYGGKTGREGGGQGGAARREGGGGGGGDPGQPAGRLFPPRLPAGTGRS